MRAICLSFAAMLMPPDAAPCLPPLMPLSFRYADAATLDDAVFATIAATLRHAPALMDG